VTDTFDSILSRRLSRRGFLGAGLLSVPAAMMPAALPRAAQAEAATAARSLGFNAIAGSRADDVRVAGNHTSQVVIRWGDPLLPGARPVGTSGLAAGALFAPGSAAAQERQFGYNCDAIAFYPLDRDGRSGILCVNNEYTNDELMFPGRIGLGREGADRLARWSRRNPEAAQVAIAAHGVSLLEVRLDSGEWRPQAGSPHARRISGSSPVGITGPARGHDLLRTHADPRGTTVLGTLANCAGGRTPWGTYLTAEENLDDYFGGYRSYCSSDTADARVVAAHRRLPLLELSHHGWEHTVARFDVRREPREALRFGWIVEIDPYDPGAPVRKRTALGRFSHEGASCALARDGRVAVYSGDDDKFEYLYKFVSRDPCDPRRREANRDLLDHGTLYVARFDADGSGEWLALVHGQGPLVESSGFADQGELLIKARAAADLVGATPMDRPEDVEAGAGDGRVFVAFTKNDDRTPGSSRRSADGRVVDFGVDAANPRPANQFGHILEILEHDGDVAARRFRWNVFLLAGDPQAPGSRLLVDSADLVPGRLAAADTYYAGRPSGEDLAPIGCPDNLALDPDGNLWIVTDGAQPRGDNNGGFAVPIAGPERGLLRQFMSAPRGAEVCGCEFTPDGETLFMSIQHPGEGGTLESPVSDWPDGRNAPPRPSVIAIRRSGGGRVGS
jgi:secreted PhoX family phosphatase